MEWGLGSGLIYVFIHVNNVGLTRSRSRAIRCMGREERHRGKEVARQEEEEAGETAPKQASEEKRRHGAHPRPSPLGSLLADVRRLAR